MAAYPRGTEWRMWDLHIHTPESIVQNYKGMEEERWPRFIQELEALPPDVRVIGINDYWFLDGYRKVRAEKEAGRLANIDEIFPVIEVRCDTFSGSESVLKRLNLHMILDPEVAVDDLWQQLSPLLQGRYRLTPGDDPKEWTEVVSAASMERLGEAILASTPEEKQSDFSNMSARQIAFNNLNVSWERVVKGIEAHSFLREHVILALGKIEWDNIKWSLGSIAQKKTYVNSVDAVFTAAKSREAFDRSLASLTAANVRRALLDCSDAHNWSDSDLHTRLGFCFTWINSDPSFKGLRQALQEYDQRVTTAERPDVLTRIAQSPRSVIRSVALRPTDTLDGELRVFNSETQINPGFVVVIGNKGQGKSALLDNIALAANSDRQDDFSFLNPKRFRSLGGPAAKYEVEITWADASTSSARMDSKFAPEAAVRVDYLPQSLIEKVCSADPNSPTSMEFESEIERVVFRHIDDGTRESASSLRQLLQWQGVSHERVLVEARSHVAAATERLSALRRRNDELTALGLASRKSELESRLSEVKVSLDAVNQEIDSGGSEEQQTQAAELRRARDIRQQAVDRLSAMRSSRDDIAVKTETVEELKHRLLAEIAVAMGTAEQISRRIGLASESLLEISFEETVVDAWLEERVQAQATLVDAQTQPGGLDNQLAVATRTVEDQEKALQALNEGAQQLLTKRADLTAQIDRLIGEASDPETIRGINALESELGTIPSALDEADDNLRLAFSRVHESLLSIKELQRAAYDPATQFVQSNELAKSVDLAFDVEFRVREFGDRWLSMVNRQRLGRFFDLGRSDLDSAIFQDVDLESSTALKATLDQLVDRLGRESGDAGGARRSLDTIMRSGHTPAGLLSSIYGLEWLESQYIIRAGGSELSELSPGQRGLVLLLFYLLVDKSERPLLLDQPEENLDNQTVRKVLVPALREAVKRRQVIAVTHNPNFAVVGDADQIIVASFEGHFNYRSGSLAEVEIGESTIDVLEGTRGAFNSRSSKYTDVVGR